MTTLLQSMLFVPGADDHKLAKLDTLDAPAFILDLEDAVALAAKPRARQNAAEVVRRSAGRRIYVRVNSLRTGLTFEDLDFVVRAGLSGVVMPKVESAADISTIDERLTLLEHERGIDQGSIELIATIETVAGVRRADEIAAFGGRLRCLGFGAGDFCLDLGLEWPPADGRLSEVVISAKVEVVMASRFAGLEPPHDGAFPNFRDLDGLRAEAEQARRLGFYGKHSIHPAQVRVISDVFTPTDREVARAHEVVEAFDRSERDGKAAIQLEGTLIDYPVAERARRLLTLAESIERHGADNERG